MLEKILAVAIGGAIGASLRFIVVEYVQNRLHTGFPYGTMAVNIVGAFVIGFLMMYFLDVEGISVYIKLFMITGCLGGFTTFSTFSYEFATLLEQANYVGASIYGVIHLALGLLGCVGGMALGRIVF